MQTERLNWENAQYSRHETIKVVGIPLFFREEALKEKLLNNFGKQALMSIKVTFEACHRLSRKDYQQEDRTFVTFFNRNDGMHILRIKKNHLGPSKLSFSEETKIFINESLCNKCKKLRVKIKAVCLLALIRTVQVTLEENVHLKV